MLANIIIGQIIVLILAVITRILDFKFFNEVGMPTNTFFVFMLLHILILKVSTII